MYLHVKQLLPHRKEPRGWLVCEGLRSLALTSNLLRLLELDPLIITLTVTLKTLYTWYNANAVTNST